MRLTFPNPFGPPISLDTDNITPLLPTTSRLPSTSRRTSLRVLLLVSVLALLIIWHPSPPLPPSYAEELSWERNVPWLYEGEAYEGRDGRFLKFESPRASGFNQQLQTVLFQHHLAVLSNRSFAYDPLIQDETSILPFVAQFPPWRSAQVPLSALIATVISGFERLYDVPRAVSYRSYRGFCSSYRETVYQLKDEDHPDGNLELSRDGLTRIHQLQALLAGTEEKCLRIHGRVFDEEFFNSETLLQTYPSFSQSPVLKHFSLSPSVLSIVNRVLPEVAPESAPYDIENVFRAVSTEGVKPGSNWKHILALHVRHGDEWAKACENKGIAAAPFVGWSKIPEFPGNENVPPPSGMTEAARLGLYRAKCLPETLDIIARARRMRKNHPFLRTVYILADELTPWAEEVKKWLLSEGWEHVWLGQKDIWPSWQEREIGVGVDMEIARRSGVFVGNGFSTTSSNIALLRARDGIHPDLTQFW